MNLKVDRSEIADARGRIAVIDDDDVARVSIGQMLRLRRYRADLFASAEAALAWPGLPEVDCIISDVKMPGMGGEEFLASVRLIGLACPIIMITGHGDIAMAVRCLKAGAYDFVEKPFEDDFLLASVARAVERSSLSREARDLRARLKSVQSGDEEGKFGMVGRSDAMRRLYQQIEMTARFDVPVLIVGETGSGKELTARAIHSLSRRSAGPFVPVNAGGLPDTMLESELFGHAKGAFTGADTDRDGKLVTASGGTLLLDEIESISPRAQVQLLRVLEDGLVHPLGKDTSRLVDIRLVATTKVDLAELVGRGALREDFYHRVVVATLDVPPLRDRREDIPLLAAHFLSLAAARSGAEPPHPADSLLAEWMKREWPGNVREFRNVVERFVITGGDPGMAGVVVAERRSRLMSIPASKGLLQDALAQTERAMIEQALRECGGEVVAVANALGVSRRGLYERLHRHGLDPDTFRKGANA